MSLHSQDGKAVDCKSTIASVRFRLERQCPARLAGKDLGLSRRGRRVQIPRGTPTPSSNGQDTGLSRRIREFESPWGQSACSSVWQSARPGSGRSWVQIPPR